MESFATEILPLDSPVIINDVAGLQLGPLPREESRWLVNDVDVSEKWHIFKEKSLKLAKERGLFVESHAQQILYAFIFAGILILVVVLFIFLTLYSIL